MFLAPAIYRIILLHKQPDSKADSNFFFLNDTTKGKQNRKSRWRPNKVGSLRFLNTEAGEWPDLAGVSSNVPHLNWTRKLFPKGGDCHKVHAWIFQSLKEVQLYKKDPIWSDSSQHPLQTVNGSFTILAARPKLVSKVERPTPGNPRNFFCNSATPGRYIRCGGCTTVLLFKGTEEKVSRC